MGTIAISHCSIANNTAGGLGSEIYNISALSMVNSTINREVYNG